MGARPQDWFRQAQYDLAHARRSIEAGDYEWACFAAQQSAEKAVKALFQKLGAEAWGHAVNELLRALPEDLRPPPDLVDMARTLDTYYIPTRYPNAHPQGIPRDYYPRREAERAVAFAEEVLRFCEGLLFP